jgi:hypothetical protein
LCRSSSLIKWLNEYSDGGAKFEGNSAIPDFEGLISSTKRKTEESKVVPSIKVDLTKDSRDEDHERSFESLDSDEDAFGSGGNTKSSHTSSIRKLYHDYERAKDLLQTSCNSREFDIFSFTSKVGREKTLPLISLHLFLQHNVLDYAEEPQLARFLNEVYRTYRQNITYHNDLHGIDVA